MLGAIIGDIAGSVYEFNNAKTEDFPLITKQSNYTDDTICTIAVADAEGANVVPVSGKTNVFLLGGIGDQYTVTVSKDGYTTQTQTVSNNSDQTITIELVNA